MKTEKRQAAAAAAFAERWKGRGYEKGDSQLFWTELLTEVFGVENPSSFVRYEEQVKVDKTNFIDGHIPLTRVLIEQKSIDKDLRKGIVQSDGAILNPFQQAKRYVANMPLSEHPRWIVTCNFKEFLVYDMEQPNGEPEQILLQNLGKEYYRLQFLVDAKSEHLRKEMEVSMQAGEIVGRIYDALLRQYDDNSPEALRWLNILCVRIVFCLYAEDAGVFAHDQFHDYLVRYDAEDLRNALIRLFDILNTPEEKRSKYLKDDLKAFPYTNGGLFEEEIEIPQFTAELKQTLLQNASLDFDWSEISPTIFGAVFESTLNPETRRSGGMHYTSIENIHKVIDPLFLNDLRRELDTILEEKVERQRMRKLDEYQMKLSSLTFLDPACGSGNFLTETYLSLRRLENEVIRERYHGQTMMGAFVNPIKVSIQQFYGIEINDFAVTVATTALWISEAQMLAETERIVHQDIDFLPLKPYHNIREGNALRMDWVGADASERQNTLPSGTLGSVPSYIGADASERRNALTDASERQNTLPSGTLGSVPSYTLQFMERDKYIAIKGSTLPHWHQDNKVQFVTFRLADSLPQQKLAELSAYKEEWLNKHPQPWDAQTQEAYNHDVLLKVDRWLDNGYGDCILGHEEVRKIVADALLFYHGKRYLLHHFVIMPNHVHLLLSPIGDYEVTKSVGSVKQFTANAINRTLNRTGEVWQRNVFDRMVRDAHNYDAYVNYIYNNPRNLLPDQFTIGGDASSVATAQSPSFPTLGSVGSYPTPFPTLGSVGSYPTPVPTLGSVGSYPTPVPTLGSVGSYDYIMGNPPFIGARMMAQGSSQKKDVEDLFGNIKDVQDLDYVCCWYKKAAQLMQNSHTKTGFVSTNSICQGSQVPILWNVLLNDFHVHINFAYQTFKWNSEASEKAAVHCVIIGFSTDEVKKKYLFSSSGQKIQVSSISPYLFEGDNTFAVSRKTPLCDVPQMNFGNQPRDGGHFVLSEEEKEQLIQQEPSIARWIRPYIGAEEFIKQKSRYCLWLRDAQPADIKQSKILYERVQAVRAFRLASSAKTTQGYAKVPHLFAQITQPEGQDYLLVPSVSSERRRYVPIGFMKADVISSNAVQIIPNATLYHFGVLTSNVHMAWMRVVCGRLEMRYRYSKEQVYNTFPWPLGADASKRRNALTDASERRNALTDASERRNALTDASECRNAPLPGTLGSVPSYIGADASERRNTLTDSDAWNHQLLPDAWNRQLLPDAWNRQLLPDAWNRQLLPDAWKRQLLRIEQTAQAILDVRAKYSDSSLADLYDEVTMPADLRRAHQENDRAVMQAYGFPVNSSFTESQCVAELFKLYQALTASS